MTINANFEQHQKFDLTQFNGSHWKTTLEAIGVPSEILSKKNVPCPFCGGQDRYTYSNIYGRGDSYCRHCGYHSGFDLVMRFCSMDFFHAVRKVAEIIGVPVTAAPMEKTKVSKDDRLRSEIQKVLRDSEPIRNGDLAWNYLSLRGLVPSANLQGLRFHKSLTYFRQFDEKNFTLEHHPALLGEIRNPQGDLVAVHRTYLSEKGKADVPVPKKVLGAHITGGCVRLFDCRESSTLGIAEGIETALAANVIFGIPVWSALSAGNLAKFEPPAHIRKLVICADNDANFVGQKAAYTVASSLKTKNPNLVVDVRIPKKVGFDWNDVLMHKAELNRAVANP